MTQYINKADVVAEVTRLKVRYECGWNCALDKVLEHIDDLEVKEINLNDEIEKCLKKHSMLAVGKKDFTDIAKHFFELGIKAAQKGEYSYVDN